MSIKDIIVEVDENGKSNFNEFKKFVEKYPSFEKYVNDKVITWQQIYDIWNKYGEDSKLLDKYKKYKKEEKKPSRSGGGGGGSYTPHSNIPTTPTDTSTSGSNIYIDPNAVMSYSNDMSTLGSDTSTAASGLETSISAFASAWQGSSYNSFAKNCESVALDIGKIGPKMSEASNAIKNIAKGYTSADSADYRR